jgi:hypothetical protein
MELAMNGRHADAIYFCFLHSLVTAWQMLELVRWECTDAI